MIEHPNVPDHLRQGWQELLAILRQRAPLALAFSGGVDSSLLLAAATQALPREQILPVLCLGPLTPPWEAERARSLAASLGLDLLELDGGELDDPLIAANDDQRCYHCKRRRLSLLLRLAQARGLASVVEGSQLDDLGEHRPGNRAKQELGVSSPLMEAGLDKAAVRELSQALGLATAQVPSSACLATRLPTGTPLTLPALERIARAEGDLRRLLPGQLRLRDHFPLARLELPPQSMATALAQPLRSALVQALQSAGYTWVCLDLQGYRPGGEINSPANH